MGLEKIVEYKKKLGLTNEELSNLSGVPKGTLDKILSGITKDPKLGTLKALARVFNCTLDDFDDFANSNIEDDSLSSEESILVSNYKNLNQLGKTKLIEYSVDLVETPKYVSDDDFQIELFAAHNDGIDEETNKRNIEKIKAKYAQMHKK